MDGASQAELDFLTIEVLGVRGYSGVSDEESGHGLDVPFALPSPGILRARYTGMVRLRKRVVFRR